MTYSLKFVQFGQIKRRTFVILPTRYRYDEAEKKKADYNVRSKIKKIEWHERPIYSTKNYKMFYQKNRMWRKANQRQKSYNLWLKRLKYWAKVNAECATGHYFGLLGPFSTFYFAVKHYIWPNIIFGQTLYSAFWTIDIFIFRPIDIRLTVIESYQYLAEYVSS